MGSPALLSRAAHLISSTQQRLNACPAEKKNSLQVSAVLTAELPQTICISGR